MFTNRISKAIVVLLVLAIASVTASFVPRSTSENHVDERYGEPPEKIAGLIAEQKIHREYILGERYGVTPQHAQSVQREYWLGERYGQAPSASLSTIEGANDFYQRHPDWTWAIKDQNAVIPLTGDSAFPD